MTDSRIIHYFSDRSRRQKPDLLGKRYRIICRVASDLFIPSHINGSNNSFLRHCGVLRRYLKTAWSIRQKRDGRKTCSAVTRIFHFQSIPSLHAAGKVHRTAGGTYRLVGARIDGEGALGGQPGR